MISLDIFQIPLKRFYRAERAAGWLASASHNLSLGYVLRWRGL